MMNPVLVAATVLLLFICAFDMVGILVRMLGGTYPVLQIAVLRNLFAVLPAFFALACAAVVQLTDATKPASLAFDPYPVGIGGNSSILFL